MIQNTVQKYKEISLQAVTLVSNRNQSFQTRINGFIRGNQLFQNFAESRGFIGKIRLS